MRTPSRLVSVLALVLALGMSGCSVAQQAVSVATAAASSVAAQTGPNAEALWEKAKASMAAATSARLKGTATEAGTTATIDLAGTRDGSNSKVVVSQSGWTAEILTVGDSQYVKGDAAYWKVAGLTDAVITKLGSKYVRMPKDATNSFTLGSMFDELQTANFNIVDKVNLKAEKVDLAGVSAYLLSQRVSTDDDFKAWISADDSSNLLRLSVTGGTSPVDLTFSEWNAVPVVAAPAAADVIAV